MRRILLASSLLAASSACTLGDPGTSIVYSPCHALSTGKWRAHVARIDISTQKAPLHHTYLFVEGEVTAPQGDEVAIERGPVQQLSAPVQQIIVRTDGPGTGAPVVHRVSGRFRPLKRYGSIAIRCGDGIVGMVANVPRLKD